MMEMFFYIYILIYISLPLMIFTTYRVKNNHIKWFFILFPPLTLIFLAWIPSDISTIIFWGPVTIAVLFSVFSIIINLLIALTIKLKKKKPTAAPLRIRLVRPILVVCIVAGVSTVVRLSLKSADVYAVETAKRLQLSCNENSICPETIQGWDESNSEWMNCSITYGKYGTKYPICYSTNEDLTEFSVSVRHNIDKDFLVEGGVNKKLKAEYSICSNVKIVDINTLEPIDSSDEIIHRHQNQ